MADWLLVEDPPLAGGMNMALDSRLLSLAEETGTPVLRLYGWDKPTLSLGRTQKPEGEIDLAACRRLGVPLVRRVTGGRAVLHGDDLTYAVMAPALPGGPFGATIMAAYQTIAQLLAGLLAGLGLPVEIKPHTARERLELASANCFATPSAYEILVGGKKLIGSAQRRRPGAFLQHGSIPLRPKAQLLGQLFVGSDASQVASTMADLESLGLWRSITPQDFRQALVEAFAKGLNARFTPYRLPQDQLEKARQEGESYWINP